MANSEWRMVNRKTLNSHHNAQLATQFYALRFTLYAQLSTLNAQLTTRNLFSLSRPNLFVADATPTSIIAVCRSPVKGEIFVLNGTRDRVRWRHGETEKRRHGKTVTKNKNANRFFTHHAFTHYASCLFLVPRPSPLVPFCCDFRHGQIKNGKNGGEIGSNWRGFKTTETLYIPAHPCS